MKPLLVTKLAVGLLALGLSTVVQAQATCALTDGEEIATFDGTALAGAEGTPAAVENEEHAIAVAFDGCDVSALTIEITWLNPAADLDFRASDPAGNQQTSGNAPPATTETVAFGNPAEGTYRATVVSFANTDTDYQGSVRVTLAAETVDDDADLDGIAGDDDNCPTTFNPSQDDADEDGVGDACDDDAHPVVELDTPTVIYEEDGTAGVSASNPPIAGPDEGVSSNGSYTQEFTFTIPDIYSDYASLLVELIWLNPAEYYSMTVVGPTGQSVTGLFVNTADQEALFTLPIAGEYRIFVNEHATVGTPFELQATVVRSEREEVEIPQAPDIVSDPGKPRTIVAVIDSAINPYHAFYNYNSPIYPERFPSAVTQEVLDDLKVTKVVELTRTGNMALDLAADKEIWDNIERGELVHFKGTNIIAASYAGADEEGNPLPLLKPDGRKSPHGVGTSSAVLTVNPEAVILFVETHGDLANDPSHDLAFKNDHVDIVSTSYGAGIPNTGFPLPETRAFRNTYEAVVLNGKMHFSSGGNGRGLTPLRAGAGPWWSIGVSGIEEGSSGGDTALSGNFPDFVSDFTQDLPYCMDCQAGTSEVGGTSFSTPRAAGVASLVLQKVRTMFRHEGGIVEGANGLPVMAAGHGREVSNWFLRRALEQAAWLVGTDDFAAYDPVEGVSDIAGLPINPAAPWTQMGWGDLSALPSKGVIPAVLSHLNLGDTNRVKDQGACDFQTEVIEARQEYWNQFAPQLPSVLGGEPTGNTPPQDPFIYCGSSDPTSAEANDPGGQGAPEDLDGDGVGDDTDNCPFDANSDQADGDGDGTGNACDDSFDAPDQDSDLIADDDDNCPMTANPAQNDADGDGEGDACDATPNGPIAPFVVDAVITADVQGDGLTVVLDAAGSEVCTGDDCTTEGLSYTFHFGDDSEPATAADGETSVVHTYPAAGTWDAFVVVSHTSGNQDFATESVTTVVRVDLEDAGDQNRARLTARLLDGTTVPARVRFDATRTTKAEGFGICDYTFDFDDGNSVTTTQAVVDHVYTRGGSFEPSVVVSFSTDCADDTVAKETSQAKSAPVTVGTGSTPGTTTTRSAGGGSGGLGWLLLVPLALAGIRRRIG